MPVPKTAQQWWKEYDAIADDVNGYISTIYVNDLIENPLFKQRFGERLHSLLERNREGNPTIQVFFKRLAQKRDKRLYHFLHTIWEDAPDAPYIHTWPSWGRFCDLLSEGPHLLRL